MRSPNLFTKSIVVLTFMFFLSSFSAYSMQEKGSDVMVVEIIFSFNGPKDVSGIYVSKPDGTTNKIPLIGFVGEENIQKNGIIIAKELKKIYDEGWELESSCGGDNSKRYIFTK